MNVIRQLREERHFSQRKLAEKAGISFRALQLAESGKGNPRMSTLNRIGAVFGHYPDAGMRAVELLWGRDTDSIWAVSDKIVLNGSESWKLFLFEFVDAFRRNPSSVLIDVSPVGELNPRITALMASVVEMLCSESAISVPSWAKGVGVLSVPWFVAGVENLKASALVESPVYFRKRLIFVLDNFLERR
jgi:transcriptional regulator with XRE-family HTH domain